MNNSFTVATKTGFPVNLNSWDTGNSLKDKLEHFYYAYNKSLFLDDGMNFSEEEADEDMPSQEPIRPSTKWSLLQSKSGLLRRLEFICQNNLQRFTDNLEDISKGIARALAFGEECDSELTWVRYRDQVSNSYVHKKEEDLREKEG